MKLPRELINKIQEYLDLDTLCKLKMYYILKKKYIPRLHTRDWAIFLKYNYFLNWLCKNNIGSFTIYSSSIACKSGNISGLKYLYTVDKKYCNYSTYLLAIEHGHLGILEWLESLDVKYCGGECLDFAARSEDLNLLTWLYTNHEKCKIGTYLNTEKYLRITNYLNRRMLEHVG